MIRSGLRSAGIIGAIVMVAGVLFWLVVPKVICSPDEARTAIEGANWVVVVRADRCSAIDGSSVIYAENIRSKKRVDIAHLNDAADFSVKSVSRNKLEITLPNLVDFTPVNHSFDDIAVHYNFLPKDDPEARAQYQFWVHHHTDPAAVRWCKAHLKAGC